MRMARILNLRPVVAFAAVVGIKLVRLPELRGEFLTLREAVLSPGGRKAGPRCCFLVSLTNRASRLKPGRRDSARIPIRLPDGDSLQTDLRIGGGKERVDDADAQDFRLVVEAFRV